MHDIVLGLFVNRYEFGLSVCNRTVQICNTTPDGYRPHAPQLRPLWNVGPGALQREEV